MSQTPSGDQVRDTIFRNGSVDKEMDSNGLQMMIESWADANCPLDDQEISDGYPWWNEETRSPFMELLISITELD
jgi:hypothetical protein